MHTVLLDITWKQVKIKAKLLIQSIVLLAMQ